MTSATPPESLEDFLGSLNKKKSDLYLFRGQRRWNLLLPRIARNDPKRDTTAIERDMLKELRRRGAMFLPREVQDDWELLVYAQHFGMATRLLDWTTNPLIALWFACMGGESGADSYVYVFLPDMDDCVDREQDGDPFALKTTKILNPSLNNARIMAQSGWFTAHPFVSAGSPTATGFIPIDLTPEHGSLVFEMPIPNKLKQEFIVKLNTMGINQQSVFPDIDGICGHINWLFEV